MITPEQLAAWKATTAAIHGPWHAEAYQDGTEPQYLKDADGDHLVSTQEDYEIDPIDVAFMAVASEAMPLLLAEVERLQQAATDALRDLESGTLRDLDGSPWHSPLAIRFAVSHLQDVLKGED